MSDLDALREEWKEMYSKTLPQLATSKDPVQPRWPVHVDHCFGRIILDTVVGQGEKSWDKVIPKPAIRNMSAQQLQDVIKLGNKIADGTVDLCELDEASLQCRGKNESKFAKTKAKEASSKLPEKTAAPVSSRKRSRTELDDDDGPSPKKSLKMGEKQSTLEFWRAQTAQSSDRTLSPPKRSPKKALQPTQADFKRILKSIQTHPTLTPYRKRLYTTLLSVPSGKYTTYAAMSDYLQSSARAVGNGMRNNPFAPEVPCHRVLAADGSIGGFHGDWGKDGKHAAKKIELLRGEGIKFDPKGKVVGEPWRKFHNFEHLEAGVPD